MTVRAVTEQQTVSFSQMCLYSVFQIDMFLDLSTTARLYTSDMQIPLNGPGNFGVSRESLALGINYRWPAAMQQQHSSNSSSSTSPCEVFHS